MVRLKNNIVLVTSALLFSVIIHSNYVSASDYKSLTDLETPEEPLVNFDDTGEDVVQARNRRLVPTLGYIPVPRTLRRLQRSPLEAGDDILAKGAPAEEEGAAEESSSSSKRKKGKKKKKKKKRKKDKKTSSVEEPTEPTSAEKSDSKVESSQPSSSDLTPQAAPPTDPPLTLSIDMSNIGSGNSGDDPNSSKTSNSGDSGNGNAGKSQGGEDDGSDQKQYKSYKIGAMNVRQDSGQKSKVETINSDTKEIIPLHKDLPPMQRQQQKQIHRQELTQYNRQDTSLPVESINFDRSAFKMPQMTQMAPLQMAALPNLSGFYSPMGGSKSSSFAFPSFPGGQQTAPAAPAPTNENPSYPGNLGYPPYSSNSASPVNPVFNPGANPMNQMNPGNMPGGGSYMYGISNRAFGSPDGGGHQYGGSPPGPNFFSMNGGFLNQAQSSFNSQSSSSQFQNQFGST